MGTEKGKEHDTYGSLASLQAVG